VCSVGDIVVYLGVFVVVICRPAGVRPLWWYDTRLVVVNRVMISKGWPAWMVAD
jgi:hypothetical protein